jgi:SmpA/OmlA family protein
MTKADEAAERSLQRWSVPPFPFCNEGAHMSQRSWFRQLGLLTVLAALTLALTGCGGNKVTKENAEKIKDGMTEAEVTGILGSPAKTGDGKLEGPGGLTVTIPGAKILFYENGANTLVVALKDGKVFNKVPNFK